MTPSERKRETQAGAGIVAAIVLAFAFGYGLCYFFLVFPKEQLARRQVEVLEERERLAMEQLEQLQLLTKMSEEQLVEWVARNRQSNQQFADLMTELSRRDDQQTAPSIWLTLIVVAGALIGFGVAAWLIRDGNSDAATTLRNIANAAPRDIVRQCVAERLDQRFQPAPGPVAVSDLTGIVKNFNEQKGFGFIVPDDGGKDVFFHVSGVELEYRTRIEQGVRLRYRSREGTRGIEAVNIEVA